MTVSPRSRQLRSSELGNFVDELDNWLRPDQSWSLRDEFPQVFGPRSRAQHFVLDLGDETVAHAAALDLDMRVHGRSWHPRLVGSVVVDPHHRGLGLGRAVMEEVVRNFESSSREALVLWSDKPGFYAKLGFEPFGHEFHVSVDGHGVEAPEPRAELRPARERDLEELLLLHLGKPIHSARSLGDFESFVRIPDCKTYVADRDGHVVAYACIGKGLDFPNFAHELGGTDADVTWMLRELATHSAEPLGVLLPLWRVSMLHFTSGLTSPQGSLRLGPHSTSGLTPTPASLHLGAQARTLGLRPPPRPSPASFVRP
jgi:GNAT superfamily N-acetyltransferase